MYNLPPIVSPEDTAPATQGGINFLAELATKNTCRIDNLNQCINDLQDHTDSRFDKIDVDMFDGFNAIQKMIQPISKHISSLNQKIENCEERLQAIGA